MRDVRRATGLVWRSAPRLTLFSGAITLVSSLLPLVALYQMKLLLDEVAASAQNGALAQGRILNLVLAMGALAMLMSAIRSLSGLISEMHILEVADHMKTMLHAKSVEVDLEYYEDAKYQDTLRRAQSEAPIRPTKIVNSLIQVTQSGLSLLAIAALVIFTLHWGFLAALLLAALPGLWLRARSSKENFDLMRRQTATERAVAYVDLVLTHDWFAKELRLFSLGGVFSKHSQELRTRLRLERMTLAKRKTRREVTTQFFTNAAIYGSLGMICVKALQGTISLGSLVMYYQALQRGQSYLQDFISGLSQLYENNLFLKNLYEFLDIQPRVAEIPNPVPVPTPPRRGLKFDNVTFRYPGKTTVVLHDISFEIKPGQRIALVGENGSGKTTLVKLMCRLYDPTEGAVTLEGVDIRGFSVAAYRKEFSVIFQDFVKYHMTVAQNIGLGNVEHYEDRERIIAAAKYSGADEFISRLSKGYESMMGRVYDEGEEISGGEWQKLALARAFLRESPFIIMDEPTSAMDARAEYEVFKRFTELAAGRSAVLISHRLSTVRMADLILLMEDGRIIERGSHDELIALNGKYAAMFEMQAKSYR